MKKGPKKSAEYFGMFRGLLSKKELFLLNFAYDLSKYAHGYLKQTRDTGERYFNHPREVSFIIFRELGIKDLGTHLVALLHDCDEDTHLMTAERISKIFGRDIGKGVAAVSKKNLENVDKEKYLKSYFKNIAKTGWRECVVKCGDRIHNLRSLPMKTEKDLLKVKRQIAETNELFPMLIPVIKKHNKALGDKVWKLIEIELVRLQKAL